MCDRDYDEPEIDDVEHECELCEETCDCGGLEICYWCSKCNEETLTSIDSNV